MFVGLGGLAERGGDVLSPGLSGVRGEAESIGACVGQAVPEEDGAGDRRCRVFGGRLRGTRGVATASAAAAAVPITNVRNTCFNASSPWQKLRPVEVSL